MNNLGPSKIREEGTNKERRCLKCNSKHTYIGRVNVNTGTATKYWFHYRDGYICARCYHKQYRIANKEKIKQWHKINHGKYSERRISFQGKRILLKVKPRTGQCKKCFRKVGDKGVKRTLIHHIEYDDYLVLRDTIELCVSCHSKIHWEMRKQKGKQQQEGKREAQIGIQKLPDIKATM